MQVSTRMNRTCIWKGLKIVFCCLQLPGTCYTFHCGPPSETKCSFSKHGNYTVGMLALDRSLTEQQNQMKHEQDLVSLRFVLQIVCNENYEVYCKICSGIHELQPCSDIKMKCTPYRYYALLKKQYSHVAVHWKLWCVTRDNFVRSLGVIFIVCFLLLLFSLFFSFRLGFVVMQRKENSS